MPKTPVIAVPQPQLQKSGGAVILWIFVALLVLGLIALLLWIFVFAKKPEDDSGGGDSGSSGPVSTPSQVPIQTPSQGPVPTPSQGPVGSPVSTPSQGPVGSPVPTPSQGPSGPTGPASFPVRITSASSTGGGITNIQYTSDTNRTNINIRVNYTVNFGTQPSGPFTIGPINLTSGTNTISNLLSGPSDWSQVATATIEFRDSNNIQISNSFRLV